MKFEFVEHRGQHRIDLDDLDNTTKIELVQALAQNTSEWGKWRFTNAAIWINKDADDLVAVVKMLQ